MKVSVNWLRDYLDINLPVNELAEKISRTAVEIEGQYQPQGDMKNIVIARVLSVEPHPDSDHMVITQVDAGEDEPIQIVTGAPNVAAGQTVILAKHGSVVGDGQKIRKGKLRGVVSYGMLVALQEIGFDDKVAPKDFEEGIWVFNPEDAKDLIPGTDALEVLGMTDDVLETGITPNRADMLSMNGTAYEIAAILDETLTRPTFDLKETSEKTSDLISAEAPSALAPYYGLRIVKNVKIGDSPLWLQKRLWTMGIRPINNVVDVTNYMLLMYGQPLHAFDFDTLPSHDLHVRTAHVDEQIKTLDGVERTAGEEDLIIAAGEQGLMFAGVMGGESTEVTAQTTNIVLEAAVFEPKSIRHAARDQNLHSEASQRFERGVNVAETFKALDHAAALIAELAGGEITQGRVVAQQATYHAPVVSVKMTDINRVLGTSLTAITVAGFFKRLDFAFELSADEFTVTIPARRWDISIPADLIEEIARLYGYDNLPTTLPVGATTPGQLTPKQKLIRATRHDLEGLGLNQAISYVLTTPEKAAQFKLHHGEPIQLDYPMTQDRQQTRSSILTGLLDDVAYNVARNQNDVALYEQGRVFVSNGNKNHQPAEIEHVAGVITGAWQARSWQTPAESVDFFALKGIVEQLLANYAFEAPVRFEPTDRQPEMHPGQTANIFVGETRIGFIGQIHPLVAKAYKINQTFAFEMDLDLIATLARDLTHYEAITRFPSISRDLAILVGRQVSADDIKSAILEAGGKHLANIMLFDVYTGQNVAHDKKSLAYSLTFIDPEKTLVDDEINTAVERITKQLAKQFDAEIR
ncbi:phenylalanine--tRNA ligase subunit beta [Weissella diestrammenae]|uniref:Phenylalanine--tRNA ligase beta subunit n=1 Tax=Weissella diestrammenae TaxID=1162633 RepID=A0A7G9T3T4_9LACO|nr:phenylalanine--tRNA ligase subunit beta [Weissella diestrammenae]MCM0582744.1 phenylalanine--tRNA ligase subunit beta [Weissella diestrammenae]QNN74759.1 phenylalanine--tRNA ligase subunit beta [Weissella diestrammenae]